MNHAVCHVLIIDDSPDDRADIRQMLLRGSGRRYHFTEAEIGAEGVRACQKLDRRLPDCVLLDFHLPDMDAREVLARLSDAEGVVCCPVVVLTGSDTAAGPVLLRAGAQDYIGKSWSTPESLTRAVENAIQRFALFAERRATDQRLRDSEERMRLSRDAAFLISFEWDILRDEVRRFHSNDPALGPTADDAPDTLAAVSAIVHPEDRVRFTAQVYAALEPGAAFYENEFRIMHPDGGTAWLFERGYVKRDAHGRALKLIGLSQDVTARKRRELNIAFLADTQKIFAPLTSVSEIVQRVAERTARHLGLAHCLVFDSQEAGKEAILLYEHHASAALSLAGRFHPAEFATEAEQRALAAGQTLLICDHESSSAVRADRLEGLGVRALALASCFVGGHSALTLVATRAEPRAWSAEDAELLRELTERTHVRLQRARAEERLRISEERFRKIYEHAATGIVIGDLQGRLLHCNPTFCAMVGRTQHELRKMIFSSLVHPEDREANIAENNRLLEENRSHFEIENRYIRPDGESVWVHKFVSILRDDVGAPVNLLALITDVSRRRQVELHLQAAKEIAEAANRSKDRFLAVLSHELRTPLTPVLLNLSAMVHDPKLQPEIRENLAMMQHNVELEVNLIDDLLDVSRITSGKIALKLEPVDLNKAVGRACVICQSQVSEQDVRLERRLSPESLVVTADPARLQQVLWNVLKNAVKFTPAGGTVHVSTTRLGPDHVEVRVRDTGIGIPPEVLPKIFQAFEQGDASVTKQFGGLGLGLAISKAIIDLHGGTIRAESDGPGQGATFVIVLPVDKTVPAHAAPQRETPERTVLHRGSLRLLVVEDHVNTARTLRLLLTSSGHTVKMADSVTAALVLAQSEKFDAFITDLGLPDGSGYDVMAGLKKIQPLPGIVMSGYGRDEDLQQSSEAGFVDHLIKPFDIPDLLAAIDRATETVPSLER